MADEDKGWFARQASRTAKDLSELPNWLRKQDNDSEQTDKKEKRQEHCDQSSNGKMTV